MPEFKSIGKDKGYGTDGNFFAQYKPAIIAAGSPSIKKLHHLWHTSCITLRSHENLLELF